MKIAGPVRTSGQIKRKRTRKRREAVKSLLTDLGIEACYHQYLNQMSGGQSGTAAPSLGPLFEIVYHLC